MWKNVCLKKKNLRISLSHKRAHCVCLAILFVLCQFSCPSLNPGSAPDWRTNHKNFLLIVIKTRLERLVVYSMLNSYKSITNKPYVTSTVKILQTCNRVFHKHIKLAILALLPTSYCHIFGVFSLTCTMCS